MACHSSWRGFLFCLFNLAMSNMSTANNLQTINIERPVHNWNETGIDCDENDKSYWYIYTQKMTPQTKQQIRPLGGSILYIGIRNGYHLYNQSINGSCDSLISILKSDNGFVNVLPLVSEEKVSYNIYHETALYYIDSTSYIFKAEVILNNQIDVNLLNRIKNCIDSLDTISGRIVVYGTRDEMLCIAADSEVKRVIDIPKAGPPTMDDSRKQTRVDTLQTQFLDLLTTPPDTNWNSNRLYTGKGISIAVCEGGSIDSTNLDFNETRDGTITNLQLRRVPGTTSGWSGGSSATYHKTHVAATAAGSGWYSIYDTIFNQERYRFRGVAPKAFLRSESGLTQQIADVNTHSDGHCPRWYDNYDLFLDTMIANHDTSSSSTRNNNIEVISAGNEGDNSRGWSGEAGYISLRRHSKNALHAGSSQKYSEFRSSPIFADVFKLTFLHR